MLQYQRIQQKNLEISSLNPIRQQHPLLKLSLFQLLSFTLLTTGVDSLFGESRTTVLAEADVMALFERFLALLSWEQMKRGFESF